MVIRGGPTGHAESPCQNPGPGPVVSLESTTASLWDLAMTHLLSVWLLELLLGLGVTDTRFVCLGDTTGELLHLSELPRWDELHETFTANHSRARDSRFRQPQVPHLVLPERVPEEDRYQPQLTQCTKTNGLPGRGHRRAGSTQGQGHWASGHSKMERALSSRHTQSQQMLISTENSTRAFMFCTFP